MILVVVRQMVEVVVVVEQEFVLNRIMVVLLFVEVFH